MIFGLGGAVDELPTANLAFHLDAIPDFDGSADLLGLPKTMAAYTTTTEFMHAFVVTVDTVTGFGGQEEGLVDDASNNLEIRISSSDFEFLLNAGGGLVTLTRPVSTGVKYGVIARYTGGTMYLLRSGTTEVSAANATPITSTSGALTIGCRNGSYYFDGTMHFAALYSSATDFEKLKRYMTVKHGITW